MKYTLHILKKEDFEKLPYKDVKKAYGVADPKNRVAFIRRRKRFGDMKLTALHEIDELLSKISPHEENGIRYKKKSEPEVKFVQPPEPKFTMSPQEEFIFENITKPFLTGQQDLFKKIFEPTARQLGGMIQEDLTEPFQIPEGILNKSFQRARERTLSEFKPIERRATQRFASTGGLDNSGRVQQYFDELDFSKAKAIEDLAVEQALQEFNIENQSRQTAFDRAFQLSSITNPTGVPIPNARAIQAIPTINQPQQDPGFFDYAKLIAPLAISAFNPAAGAASAVALNAGSLGGGANPSIFG